MKLRFGLAALVCFLVSASAFAQESKDEVIATVGDAKIWKSQVDQEFHRKFANREVGEGLETGLRRQILRRLIDQQLVLSKFVDSDVLGTEDEINLEISRIRERLQQTEKTLEQFLEENRYTMNGLRFDLRWQISWKRYLERTLTDKILERYFQRHRRKFDGTTVRVAHCLLKVDEESAQAVAAQNELAQKVHDQLTAGKATFEETVAALSEAPSINNGGDIGWINYDGPMSRRFTEAAFQLNKGEISKPVRTPHGIHLIKCLEVREGVTPWYDVKDKVKRVATEDLFGRVAGKQKETTEVRILAADFKSGDAESGPKQD